MERHTLLGAWGLGTGIICQVTSMSPADWVSGKGETGWHLLLSEGPGSREQGDAAQISLG